jgi:hypothetical protein
LRALTGRQAGWVMCWMACRCAVVGACQVDRAVACAEGWRTACRDNRGAGGVVAEADVGGAEHVAVDVVVGAVVGVADVAADVAAAAVAVAVAVAGVAVAAVAAAEDAGRMDTYWDSSVGGQRKSEVLACKTGQDRWNIQRQKQIAIGSVSVIESASGVTVPATVKGDGRGRNGRAKGGLACLRRRMEVAVVAKKGQVRARVRGEVRGKC